MLSARDSTEDHGRPREQTEASSRVQMVAQNTNPWGSLALVPRVLVLVARPTWLLGASLALVTRVLVLIAHPPWFPWSSLALVPRALLLVAWPPCFPVVSMALVLRMLVLVGATLGSLRVP